MPPAFLKYGNNEKFRDSETSEFRRTQAPISRSPYVRLAEAVLESALYDIHQTEKLEVDQFFATTILSKVKIKKVAVLWLIGGIDPHVHSFLSVESVCQFLNIDHDALLSRLRKTKPVFREFELLIEIERREMQARREAIARREQLLNPKRQEEFNGSLRSNH